MAEFVPVVRQREQDLVRVQKRLRGRRLPWPRGRAADDLAEAIVDDDDGHGMPIATPVES